MTKQDNMNGRYIPKCALERKRSVIASEMNMSLNQNQQ